MTKLNDSHADYAKNYQAFIEDSKNSEADKAKAKINFEKENAAYQSKTFAAEISGARQIAGATAKLFGEKSAARKAFHAVEMGLSVIEMAMAAKKMVVDVAAGAANMFAQGGFAGFAGVAAMAAVMAGLGFAMSGGSSKVVDNTTPATSEKGTLLGKPDDASNSLERIIDTLNKIHADEYPELKAMADNFRGVDREMYKLNQAMARSTANFTNMQAIGIPTAPTGAGKSQNPLGSNMAIGANLAASAALGATGAMTSAGLYAGAALVNAGATSLGIGISTAAASTATMAATTGAALGATGAAATIVGGAVLGLVGGLVIAGLQYGLGKLLGIGKVKYQQIGEGIVIESGKLVENGMIAAIDAATWRKDIKTTKGWFKDKKEVVETYGQLGDEIYNALNGVSANLVMGIGSVIEILNLQEALGYKIANQDLRPSLKIDFWKDGKRVEDTTKLLEDQINAWMDRTAKNVFGALFSQYQKIGEGMMETVVRLSVQAAGIKGAFKKLNLDLGETNLGLVYFSDTLSQMYASSAKADDGLQNFMKAMNDFYDLVTTKGQKSQDATRVTGEYVANIGAGKTDIFNPDELRAVMFENEKQISESVAAAAAAQNEIAKYAPAVQDVYAPRTDADLSKLDPIFKPILGTADFNSFTWDMVGGGWDEAKIKAMAGKNSLWDDIIRVGDSNTTQKTTGLAAGGGNFASIEDHAAKQAVAEETLKIEAEKQARLLANNDELKVQISTSEKLIELQNTYLESKMNAEQKVANQRELLLKKEYAGFEQDLSSSKVFESIVTAIKKTGHQGAITAKDLQKFVWSLEDTAKAAKNLTDANKYIKDFGTNIKDWAMNLRVTSLGSTKTQLDAAALQFESKMRVINNDFLSAEQKRTALSGITGNADQYIQAIRNFYGSSKEGVDKINEVVNFVENLPEQLSVEEMQLNALDAIKTSVDGVGLDVGSILQPSLNSLLEAYKTANTLDAGLYKDALIATLDTFGTGILNAFASGDTNRQTAVAQTVNAGLGATTDIANSSLIDTEKTTAFNALNEATKAAGQFTAAYALMPSQENLALMKSAITDFTVMISSAATAIGDKNFSTVFISALGGFTTALSSSTLSLDVMGVVASGINDAVSAWAKVAKTRPNSDASDNLASGVIVYSETLKDVATDYTIDDAKKAEIYTKFSEASLELFTKISTRVSNASVGAFAKDFVSVLIGKGVATEGGSIGAIGLITSLSAVLGSSAVTYAQKKPFIDKLLDGTNAFVDGYQKAIGSEGSKASIIDAKNSLINGFNAYIGDASKLLRTSSVTDITVGMATLNGALNDVIKSAAEKIKPATAGTESTITQSGVDFSSVLAREGAYKAQQVAQFKTFNEKHDSYGIKGNRVPFTDLNTVIDMISNQRNVSLKLSDIANITTPSGMIQVKTRLPGNQVFSVYDDYKFANGGAFTNGIVDRPTNFNMGLMGEAGSEGILPLENINGSLGVNAIIPKQAANDSNVDMSETVDELKKQNEQLGELVKQTTALLKLQMAANQELVEKMSDMSESLKTSAKKTRLQATV